MTLLLIAATDSKADAGLGLRGVNDVRAARVASIARFNQALSKVALPKDRSQQIEVYGSIYADGTIAAVTGTKPEPASDPFAKTVATALATVSVARAEKPKAGALVAIVNVSETRVVARTADQWIDTSDDSLLGCVPKSETLRTLQVVIDASPKGTLAKATVTGIEPAAPIAACITDKLAKQKAVHSRIITIEIGPPRVVADLPVVQGSLDPALIKGVIQSNRERIRACFEDLRAQERGPYGTYKFQFVIQAVGLVGAAYVKETPPRGEDVAECIVDLLRTFSFPEPKGGGIVIVNYPFIFKEPT